MSIKNKIILLVAFLGALCWASCTAKIISITKTSPVVFDQLKSSSPLITESLLKLLALLNIEHDGSLSSIVEKTQIAWLRPKGQERWHMKDNSGEHAAEIWSLLKEMGLLNEKRASDKHYRYGIFLGASLNTAKERLAFLIAESNRGVSFDELIILGSKRPLDKDLEKIDNTRSPLPATESEMLALLFKEASLPDSLRRTPMTFVDVPMKVIVDGSIARPTTGDTIVLWQASDPKPGTLIAISNQPYLQYQDAVLKTLLPSEFRIETIGPAASSEPISVHLDTLARTLYQEKKRLEMGNH